MSKLKPALTRSELMARIPSRNTRPELRVRHFLWASGFRYRIHGKQLPGKPDIILPRYRTVIFVHGCFWHGHTDCKQFKMPQTRSAFWEAKIHTNQARDRVSIQRLQDLGWQVIIVWECELQGPSGRARLVQLLSEILGIDALP